MTGSALAGALGGVPGALGGAAIALNGAAIAGGLAGVLPTALAIAPSAALAGALQVAIGGTSQATLAGVLPAALAGVLPGVATVDVFPGVATLPESLVLPLTRIVGVAISGGAVAVAVAVAYRLYARERMPTPIALLLSLGVVALFLNSDAALGEVIGGDRDVFALATVVENVLMFAAATVLGPAGARAGDRFVRAITAVSGAREFEGEVSRLVRSVGRVITVTLPEEIDDVEAYDPVLAETKAELAGTTLVFPRGLTVAELRERLVERLREDYGVGHVDVDLADDGTVEYLAVGSRAAGIGPTLPPRTVAVAVRADPAFGAGVGDAVQVWAPGDPPERVLTAELRGTAGDVVTLAVDESEADELDETTRYRLVTMPTTPRADHEFAALLRAADETMGVVEVRADGELVGTTVAGLGAAVVAVRPRDGPVEPLPERRRPLEAGDVVYAVARPETLRRIQAAAGDA